MVAKLIVMPKAAIFFSILLVSGMFVNSYAVVDGDLHENNSFYNNSDNLFDSDILKIDSDFFKSNNFKRYIIFGTGLDDSNLKKNSLYGVQSSGGFFYVAVLSEHSISNLVSQGYYVIEDSQLDFHSYLSNVTDASRIGEITGSTLAQTKYNVTGNGKDNNNSNDFIFIYSKLCVCGFRRISTRIWNIFDLNVGMYFVASGIIIHTIRKKF